MIAPKEAGEALRKYLETVSDEEFRADMRRYNPHLFEDNESVVQEMKDDLDRLWRALQHATMYHYCPECEKVLGETRKYWYELKETHP